MDITPEMARAELERRKASKTITPEMARAELERRRSQKTYADTDMSVAAIDKRVSERQAPRDTPAEFFGGMQEAISKIPVAAKTAIGALVPGATVGMATMPAIMAGERIIESAVAEPALRAQRGESAGSVVQGIGKALTGQSKAELGDVYRGAGVSDFWSSAAGLATGIALPGVGELVGGSAKVGKQMYTAAQKMKPVENLDKAVKNAMQGIRISVAGRKKTPKEYQQIANSLKNAALDITDNKDALKFTDEIGNEVGAGRTPESVYEFSQAIESRKKDVFAGYDKIAQETGEQGVTVPLDEAKQALLDISKSKVGKTYGRQVKDKAVGMLKSLENDSSYSINEAQEALKLINQEMGAAWAGKDLQTYDLWKGQHDAILKNLNDAIENTSGKSAEYVALRNKYRDLKNIEKDVAHRFWVYGRRSNVGLPDMANIFSVGDFVRGVTDVARGDVAGGVGGIAKGFAQTRAVKWLKELNSPDTQVKNLFKASQEFRAANPVQQVARQADVIDRTAPRLPAPERYAGVDLGTNETPIAGLRPGQEYAPEPQGLPYKPPSERGTAPVTEVGRVSGADTSGKPIEMPAVLRSDVEASQAQRMNQKALPPSETTYGKGFTARPLAQGEKTVAELQKESIANMKKGLYDDVRAQEVIAAESEQASLERAIRKLGGMRPMKSFIGEYRDFHPSLKNVNGKLTIERMHERLVEDGVYSGDLTQFVNDVGDLSQTLKKGTRNPFTDARIAIKKSMDGQPLDAKDKAALEPFRQQIEKRMQEEYTKAAEPWMKKGSMNLGDSEKTNTPAFKKWFGDSKVVDESGKPLVVYHGTGKKFDEFSMAHGGSVTKANSAKEGFWFSSKDVAEGYGDLANTKPVQDLIDASEKAERKGQWALSEKLMAQAEKLEQQPKKKPIIVDAYLSIKNPKIYDAEGKRFMELGDEFNDIIKQAKKDGNDGVIFKNLDDNADWGSGRISDHYLVFKPTQIKSASGNKGTFDPNNPNIKAGTIPVVPTAYAGAGLTAAAIADSVRKEKKRRGD